jgi:hypothetical protein
MNSGIRANATTVRAAPFRSCPQGRTSARLGAIPAAKESASSDHHHKNEGLARAPSWRALQDPLRPGRCRSPDAIVMCVGAIAGLRRNAMGSLARLPVRGDSPGVAGDFIDCFNTSNSFDHLRAASVRPAFIRLVGNAPAPTGDGAVRNPHPRVPVRSPVATGDGPSPMIEVTFGSAVGCGARAVWCALGRDATAPDRKEPATRVLQEAHSGKG